MKRVILTGVTLLSFVAAAYAQNTATLNQNGTYQPVGQYQTGIDQHDSRPFTPITHQPLGQPQGNKRGPVASEGALGMSLPGSHHPTEE